MLYFNSTNGYKELKESLSSRARAAEAERETFFEIFFFKNFQNPDYEVERFCANYEASGWIRKNGQAATDRPALARTWTQEDKNAAPRFNADFLAKYRRFYGLAKQMNPALAPIFIQRSGIDIYRHRTQAADIPLHAADGRSRRSQCPVLSG